MTKGESAAFPRGSPYQKKRILRRLSARKIASDILNSVNTNTGANPDTTAFIKAYNPAKGDRAATTPEVWKVIRPFVVGSVKPVTELRPNSVRPFLTALTHLATFAHRHGYDLKREVVLAPAMIQAFVTKLPKGSPDYEPYLWRLSKEWGLTEGTAVVNDGVARPVYLSPYSDDELQALLFAAQNQATEHRRATLLAIIFLGLGCGIVRDAARDVCASDLHQHDGGEWFVAAAGRCAKVREGFADLGLEVISLRPDGRLRGDRNPDEVVGAAAVWLRRRRGVPGLSADRLRANYICALLNEGTALVDVLAWTGLRSCEALDGYLPYLTPSLTGPYKERTVA